MEYTYQFPGGISVTYSKSEHTKIIKAFNKKLEDREELKNRDAKERVKTDLLPAYPVNKDLYHEVMREHFFIPIFN